MPKQAPATSKPAHHVAELRQLAAGDLDPGQLGAARQADADLLADLRVGPLDRDVVEHRQRLGADADHVVDVHRHAVDADRVEAAELLGDQQLGADAVGGERDPGPLVDPDHARVVARAAAPGARVAPERRSPGQRPRPARRPRSPPPPGRPRLARRRLGSLMRRLRSLRRGPAAASAGPVGGVGPQRPVALDQPDQALRGEGRGEGGARRRAAIERRSSGAAPRRRSRTPFSAVAPTMIGSATVRESRLAWSREKRRQRAAARVAPLRETPGRERRRLGDAEREPVGGAGLAAPAPLRAACRRASIARAPASSPSAVARGPPSRRSIGRSSGSRPPPAGRKESAEHRSARRRSKDAQLLGDQPAAGRSAAPPPRRRAAPPRSSCAPRGRARSQSQPASQGTRTMWAELETGSSSAGPWTSPSATARGGGNRCRRPARSSAAGAGGLGARALRPRRPRLAPAAAAAAPPPDQQVDAHRR